VVGGPFDGATHAQRPSGEAEELSDLSKAAAIDQAASTSLRSGRVQIEHLRGV